MEANIKETVLLVESNSKESALLAATLKKGGFVPQVVRAKTGMEGMEFLFRTGKHSGTQTVGLPAAIFLDLVQDGDAEAFLHVVKAYIRTAKIPIIGLTRRKSPRVTDMKEIAGVLSKPITIESLKDLLKSSRIKSEGWF